jgi:hypothetical protein
MIGLKVSFPPVYVVLAAKTDGKANIAGAFYKRAKADELAKSLRPSNSYVKVEKVEAT